MLGTHDLLLFVVSGLLLDRGIGGLLVWFGIRLALDKTE